MVSLPAGLLEEWRPSAGWTVASAAGSRMEQPQLWRPTLLCPRTTTPSIFRHQIASDKTDVHDCISLIV